MSSAGNVLLSYSLTQFWSSRMLNAITLKSSKSPRRIPCLHLCELTSTLLLWATWPAGKYPKYGTSHLWLQRPSKTMLCNIGQTRTRRYSSSSTWATGCPTFYSKDLVTSPGFRIAPSRENSKSRKTTFSYVRAHHSPSRRVVPMRTAMPTFIRRYVIVAPSRCSAFYDRRLRHVRDRRGRARVCRFLNPTRNWTLWRGHRHPTRSPAESTLRLERSRFPTPIWN